VTVRYEVTLELRPERVEEIVRYMRETHIPEILATGCFRRIRLERAGESRYRTCYEADTRADLERYLAQHAEHFRADFRERIGDGGVPTRETWEEVQAW
jgi:hypothetical protein